MAKQLIQLRLESELVETLDTIQREAMLPTRTEVVRRLIAEYGAALARKLAPKTAPKGGAK